MKNYLACGVALGAVVGLVSAASAAVPTDIWGEQMTIRTHVGVYSVWSSANFTASASGIELLKSSPGSFNWMVEGDALDVTTSGNPVAPHMLDFHFEPGHAFQAINTLYMEVILPEAIHFGRSSITEVDNLGRVSASINQNVLSLTFYDMYLVSNTGGAEEFLPEAGNFSLIFEAVSVPEPATAALLLPAAILLLGRSRNARTTRVRS